MGHGKYISGNDINEVRRWQHNALFSSIHEARVEELHLEQGTVSISLTDANYAAEIAIPVIGLSTSSPVGENESTTDAYRRASWGRYIPQVGDILRVGFSSRGDVYALSYGSPFYSSFDYADRARESRGGIGWGETSGRDIQPGDWDFKSSRGTSFYLGNKAKLSSGALSISLDKPANKIVQSSSLNSIQAGYSYCNFGEVRRVVLPMIGEGETSVYSLRPTVGVVPFDVAKEFNVSVRGSGSIPNPKGTELASFSVGDVIDDSLPSPILMVSTGGGNVKWYRNVQNVSGLIPAFTEKVDDLGNYDVMSTSGTLFNWTTTSSTWTIINSNTNIISSGTTTITASTVNLVGMTNLGASAATDFIVKGTTFMSGLTSYLSGLSSAYAEMSVIAGTAAAACAPGTALSPLAAYFTDLIVQLAQLSATTSVFSSSLQSMLSSTVKTI